MRSTRMSIDDYNQRRALDRWSRDAGWADFDTYMRTGGSVLECKRALVSERNEIDLALKALGYVLEPVGPEALAEHEAEQSGEAPVQGGEE